MRLGEAFQPSCIKTDFANFQRGEGPPLTLSKIGFQSLNGDERSGLKTVITGDTSLLLSYKGKPAVLTSLAENKSRDTWEILQLQGVKGNASRRLCAAMLWQYALAEIIKERAADPETVARQVRMSAIHNIEGIHNAASEHVYRNYETVAAVLQLQWSEEEQAFVKDFPSRF